MPDARRTILGCAPIFWWGGGFEGALGLLAILLGWWFDRPPLATLSWDLRGLLVGVLITVPMLLGFAACVRWPVGPLGRIKHFSDAVVRPLFAPCSIAELGLISLAAGFGEEVLFRGLLQSVFTDLWGVWLGIGAASFVFGLMHLITPTYFVLAALLGVYLGGAWWLEGNLLGVIVAHALYDFVALVYLVKIEAVVDEDEVEGE